MEFTEEPDIQNTSQLPDMQANTPENTPENTPDLQRTSVSSFDDLKEELISNIESLRSMWNEHKDILLSLNQVKNHYYCIFVQNVLTHDFV